MVDEPTPFEYLLNRFECASQSANPNANNYSEHRKALLMYVRALEANAAQPDHTALLRQALEALRDMHAGWMYIRRFHGDLYGVGWDRAEGKAKEAIDAIRSALGETPSQTLQHVGRSNA